MGCALAIVFQVHSLYVPTKDRLPSWSLFRKSLVFRLYSDIGRNHVSIEAQCDHHNHVTHIFRHACEAPSFGNSSDAAIKRECHLTNLVTNSTKYALTIIPSNVVVQALYTF